MNFYGPNDEYVISGCDSGKIWIWDARTGVLFDDRRKNPTAEQREEQMMHGFELAELVGPRPCKLVNLLDADSSICNGVVPHPHLPVLGSYGIESSFKIWRIASYDTDKESYADINKIRQEIVSTLEYNIAEVQFTLCTIF